ncbi:MAG: hypothetical protein GXP24_13560 [Planctomycetes bacterium]|nr:hypothetical protein [Planctomycetota bacterium]
MRLAGLLLFAGVLVAGHAQAAVEPEPPAEPVVAQVALVRVHLPLTGNADQVLEATISRVRDRLLDATSRTKDARRPLLVLQLDPRQQDADSGAGSQFERVLSLARFLCSRELAGVKTVAFVPRSIRGHSTLLALACEEIIMAPEATLGEAGVDELREGTIGQTVIGAYREIAEARRTMPVALAIGMIDASAEVLQLETEQGTEFVLRSERADVEREVLDELTLVPAGTLASYDGREGRQFGFVKFLATNREGLARALNVPVAAIREEDTLAGEWSPTIIDLQGPITPRMANQLETMLTTALEHRYNWIGLRIDSGGGDWAASVQIATTLAKLDANSVRTVAYVASEAKGGAALAALACDQLIMHPSAHLGVVDVIAAAPADAQKAPAIGENNQNADRKADQKAELEAAKISIRHSLAPRAERSWSLLAAMIDPSVELFSYRNKSTGETRWMSAEEAAELDDLAAEDLAEAQPAVWQKGEPLVAADEPLVIDGDQATQMGLARQTVESFDELKQLYHLTADPPVTKPNWALELIEALASPEFSVILLMAGFAGIYIELRTPGVGIGAFVGAVAILLFFWSQYLNGTAGWLEVLLFVAGVSFVLMEIFVLPGFGIFGLGGGAMVIASLVLASLTFIRPQSEQDMEELTSAVGKVAIAGAGMVAIIIASRRYLPQAPLFRSVILAPPEPEERVLLDDRESLADYSHLVGKLGVAATHLRPAGKAEIDHQLIDVIAEAEPLDRGTPLEVVDAHANRVVVRATGSA